jgi:UDP:flavonoid glycosyltransferase YjiC (YdhE family)
MRVLLCPLSDAGYLYPAIAVGRELRRRGHDVHVLGRESAGAVGAQTGLPFIAAEDLGGRGGFSVARWRDGGPAQFEAARHAARLIRADAIVTSVLCHGALLAAEALDIPAVVIGLSVHLWDYRSGGVGEPQPATSREMRTRETLRLYHHLRAYAGLPPRWDPRSSTPLFGAALLLRGCPLFEYPDAVLPEGVHHIGPMTWEPPAEPRFLAMFDEHVDRVGKPLVYVHLGRFFGGRTQWPRLNAAFTAGPFQAVVEQGRSTAPAPDRDADILLVRKPWMDPFIERAGLVLSSGTSAPVLASLLLGRPLGLSPNGSEQPVLAAACVRAGVAAYVPDNPDIDHSAVLRSVWDDGAMRERAGEVGRMLAGAAGAVRAADAVEQTRLGRIPVESPDTQRELAAGHRERGK